MKKSLYLTLAAVCCLCLSSCEGLFNPEKMSSIHPDRTAEQEFWSVVGQLVGTDKRTDDYVGQTFKPTIGEPDGGDESIRVVTVNSLEGAVERFNNLVGADITAETSTYTYRSTEVGILTWNKSSDNRSWATVDVNVAAVPSLQRIIYRSPEQGDLNGSVGDNGSAYYRFGDVIFRDGGDEPDEYWICVRPAFDKEGKGKSHWVCVSPLPKANEWPYYKDNKPFTASNGFNYGLPYNLGTDLEWHQDLAELLFAIMYPEQWFQNIGSYSSVNILGNPSGLPIFNDWHCTKIKYHNINFWKNVQKQWKDKNLVKKIFGISYEEMAAALNPDPNNPGRGIHFLYDEYSWSTRLSNKPKLYQVHYTHGTKDVEKNMHKKTKTTVQAQVVEPNKKTESNINYSFDFRERQLGRELDDLDDVPFIKEQRFFGDAYPRWCVRYAEGIELSKNGKFDPQQPISGFNTGDEVYRYYKDVYSNKNLTEEAEETGENGGMASYKGRAHYKWGNVYKDENGAKWYVFNQSGFDTGSDDARADERSPYSELISFDPKAFTTSPGNGKVTNLPSLDIVLRVYPFIFQMVQNTLGRKDVELQNDDKYGKTLLNVREAAGVDICTLVQAIIAQNNDPRSSSLATCIAYDSQGSGQALVRCVMNIQNSKRDPYMFFWTKYPNTPDLTTQNVTSFSNIGIMLQDIANSDMVKKYAPDTYAVQPLSSHTLASSDDVTPRSIRTQADQRATDITNYYYDLTKFKNVQYPGSMWNEPVLVFRYTRVRDCGDSDFDTKTVDGHTLTLVQARHWEDNDYYNVVAMAVAELWYSLDKMYLNGQPYTMIKWPNINITDITR